MQWVPSHNKQQGWAPVLPRGFGLLTPNMQRPTERALEIAQLDAATEAFPLGSCNADVGVKPSQDLGAGLRLVSFSVAG